MKQKLALAVALLALALAAPAQSSTDIGSVYSLVTREIVREVQMIDTKGTVNIVSRSVEAEEGSYKGQSIDFAPYVKMPSVILVDSEELRFLQRKSLEEWKAKVAASPSSSRVSDEAPCGQDMELFREKYPNSDGIYRFHNIQFTRNGTQARLRVTQAYGCGGGTLEFTLRKGKGKWTVYTVGRGFWIA